MTASQPGALNAREDPTDDTPTADAPPEARESSPSPVADPESGTAPRRRVPVDLLVALVYVVGAVFVTGRGWLDPAGRLLGTRPDDQGFNEWMLAYAAHAVTHLENPFFTTLQNAPDGVNLMTNVGMQLPGLLLTPLTLLFGASFSYLFFITANLAGTAYAWYHVLSRHVVGSRAAAFTGGLFCAFAPALISHSNGHPHITAQWLVPFIVWRVVKLSRGGAVVRDGLILGALVSVQFFVGLEILFLLALCCAVGVVGLLVVRPREALRRAKPLLGGLAITGVLVLVVSAYPLWMQFAGPQHRVGHPGTPDAYALKLASFAAYATESLAGSPTSARGLVANTTEQASFYGWPLLLLIAGIVLWLRRELLVQVLAITGVVFAVLSIGTTWTWGTRRTEVPAPFMLLQHLPIVDSVVVARFAMITTAVVGVLLALAGDRISTIAAGRGPGGRVLAGRAAARRAHPARRPGPRTGTGLRHRRHLAGARRAGADAGARTGGEHAVAVLEFGGTRRLRGAPGLLPRPGVGRRRHRAVGGRAAADRDAAARRGEGGAGHRDQLRRAGAGARRRPTLEGRRPRAPGPVRAAGGAADGARRAVRPRSPGRRRVALGRTPVHPLS
jgi:hypothetical protein